MAKAIIVYGSTTWNTESVAEHIWETLTAAWHEVEIFSWDEVGAEKIKEADISFIWSSTWWDWEIQDDMIEFNDTIASQDLSWKPVAVFALWMTSFPQFCKAWEIIEESLDSAWAEIINEMIKIDWEVADELDNVWTWAMDSIAKI